MNMFVGIFLNTVVGFGFFLGVALFLLIAVAVFSITCLEIRELTMKRGVA
jgi:hypothetical protein